MHKNQKNEERLIEESRDDMDPQGFPGRRPCKFNYNCLSETISAIFFFLGPGFAGRWPNVGVEQNAELGGTVLRMWSQNNTGTVVPVPRHPLVG